MKPDEILAKRVAQEIEAELASVELLVAEAKNAPDSEDAFTLRGRASILHDFYTAVERVLTIIAEELNGGVPHGEQWQRLPLSSMTMEIPDVRPQVLSGRLGAVLGGYLRFRHVFRNVYGFVLEADRMKPLENDMPETGARFQQEVRSFLAWMLGNSSRLH